jgi:cell division septal protein FtsQ
LVRFSRYIAAIKEVHMDKWGFIEWFSVVSGVATIISLLITLFVTSQVVKINGNIKNIENEIKSVSSTKGAESPIMQSNEGDVSYRVNKGVK